MHAAYLERKGGLESLVVGKIPMPRPGPGEVLVAVHATAVTPTEFQWFPTFNQKSGEGRPFPVVLSHEFSGVVAAVGKDVTTFKFGEAVYGLNDWFANGAQAQFCTVAENALAAKPKSLNDAQAAVVPISALTAWQGLFDKANLQAGQRALIHGAAGGVGVFAVQLARARGAVIAATASAGNIEFVHSLGASQVIDYKSARFEEVVEKVDVVFDGVGGETLARSWDLVKPGGKVVSYASESGSSAEQRVRDAFFIVEASGAQLAEIGNLIDGGKLRVFVEETFPLEKAREAYARAQKGGMRGKVAVQVLDRAKVL
jgi:NADPH:quinone reductase-like Zn-dependent oxidoreductase